MLKPLTRMIKMSPLFKMFTLHTRKTSRNNSFKSGIFQNSYDLIFISVLEKKYKERKY